MMLHYDPQRSSTTDVVRQAMIPLSRLPGQGGQSLAALLRPGRSPMRSRNVLPETMVTHSWANKFLHLVAAVVADALKEDYFGEVAQIMTTVGIAPLIERLEKNGSCDDSYWICAFCINQHASICSGFGTPPDEGTPQFARWDTSRRDSVTGDLFQACPCGQQQHWASTSPDRCEMNKFTDMMALLQNRVEGFSQLVAVDGQFNVFERAWCVAELVEAHYSGMPQNIEMLDDTELDIYADDLSVFKKLTNLTVLDCSSSRPEDKEAILATIGNVAEFDAQLQAVIFGKGGLLSRQFIGFDSLDAAGRAARRVAAAATLMRAKSRERSLPTRPSTDT
ncbi:unnamed protein product [Polarella glacialis]|uniref:Uncharacterized protein n=1 Tax=Polarella glacialis TaxID=89957 RepID=A0A813GFR9_POLGL|nr:unnamed protein product [Polarella glacialis]